jgi:hypothetical protein
MSTEPDTSDDSSTVPDNSDDDANEDECEWEVTADPYVLRKQSYSTYELGIGAVTIEFNEVRESDGVYTLRKRKRNDNIEFDPEAAPEDITQAWQILVSEL